MILSLARQNLIRNPFRNFLTGIVLLFGVSLAILGHGLVMGIDESILKGYTESSTSDFVLETRSGLPQSKPELPSSLSWTDRLVVEATIIEEDIRIPILLTGYNRQRRGAVFSVDQWLKEGIWPENKNEVSIGVQLHNTLSTPQKITISVQNKEFGTHARRYTSSGVIQTNNPALDSRTVWLPNEELSALLNSTPEQRTHLLFKEIAPPFVPTGWQLSSALKKAEAMLSVNSIRKNVLLSLYGIILAMAIIGLISTTLVNMDERSKELALLRSLGMSKQSIMMVVIVEQLILSLLFVGIGAFLSGALNLYFSTTGFDLSSQSAALGSLSVSLLLYTSFSWTWIFVSIISTIVLSVIPPMYFVWRACDKQPIQLFTGQV